MKQYLLIALLFIVSTSHAQHRKAVGGKEVTGTFHDCVGKYCSEVKIQALGNNRLKVSFWSKGESLTGILRSGYSEGEATIQADTAIFADANSKDCLIKICFPKPRRIEVSHITSYENCGLGHNITFDGKYRKVSGKRPKFFYPWGKPQ
jgi:hypothetical protein